MCDDELMDFFYKTTEFLANSSLRKLHSESIVPTFTFTIINNLINTCFTDSKNNAYLPPSYS